MTNLTKTTDAVELNETDLDTIAGGEPICYLRYKLDRCFAVAASARGGTSNTDRPTEEVAF